MAAAGGIDVSACDNQHDRIEMLKAFDETKAGVKGIVDSGVLKVPEFFVRPSEELAQELTYKTARIHDQVPVIDLSGVFQDADRRKQIVQQVRIASETWGFFQVVNHGIPQTVLDGMIDGVQIFHEQDVEDKKKYYTRDMARNVRFNSNLDLFASRTVGWRDTLTVAFSDNFFPQELPASCRDSTMEYSRHVKLLGHALLELLSEALGLQPDHLHNMDCIKRHQPLVCHYYPASPEPELTIGTNKHSDPVFLTILLQNQINGLQFLYQGQWVDIEPTPGCLVINIGDLLQLVSNGKFKSNTHRVVSNRIGPRISVAFFFPGPLSERKIYGPIKELISEENPAKYREIVLDDYIEKFMSTKIYQDFVVEYYKL